MSLVSVPAGADSITPGWLRGALGPVRSVSARRIGEAYGLAGVTHRLDVVMDDDARRIVVAKFSSAATTRRERFFYERLAPSTPITVPEFLGGAVDDAADRGVIVLGYVDASRQGDILVGCSLPEALRLTSVAARLHATWWGANRAELAGLTALTGDRAATAPSLVDGNGHRFVDRYRDLLPGGFRRLLADLQESLPAVHRELWRRPATVIHSDLHLDNVLFVGREPRILDWASVAIGPAEIDLSRLLIECLSADQRRQHTGEIVAAYTATVEGMGVEPPPELGRRVELAGLVSLVHTVNWLGREAEGEAVERVVRLGRNLAHNTAAAVQEVDLPR